MLSVYFSKNYVISVNFVCMDLVCHVRVPSGSQRVLNWLSFVMDVVRQSLFLKTYKSGIEQNRYPKSFEWLRCVSKNVYVKYYNSVKLSILLSIIIHFIANRRNMWENTYSADIQEIFRHIFGLKTIVKYSINDF